HLFLTIHESIGHPTELDRALGYEANFAGTSYITPEKLGKARIASEHVNIYGDRTTERALGTVAYDDDGVKTTKFPIISKGIFTQVAYQARTPDFWQSCDGVAGPSYWQMYGTARDGKGEPVQVNSISHGCSPARFRQVNVIVTD